MRLNLSSNACQAGTGFTEKKPAMTDKVEAEKTQNEAAKVAQPTPAASQTVEPAKAEKNPLEKSVTFTVDHDALVKGTEARLKQIAKKAKLPGFRPGHVPMPMIRASYGQQAYFDELNELVGKAYAKAATEAKLRVAGEPRIEAGNFKDGDKEMPFTATVECYPEFEEPSLVDVKVKKYTCSVGDKEVDSTIDIMVKQRATYEEEKGRKAQSGDSVTLNFKGTKDGKAFEGGSAEGFTFVLGANRMLLDFEKGVTGLAAGEKKTFDLTFPENYGNKELAGQKVQFDVEVTKVEKPIYPAVDEKFVKSLGLDSVEAFRTEVKKNLDREVAARVRARNTSEVMDALLKLATFPLPKSLVTDEQRRLAEGAREDLKSRGVKAETIKLPPELFLDQAERRVRLGLLVSKFVEDHKLAGTEAQVKALVAEIASAYEKPEEMTAYIMNNRNYVINYSNVATENNLVNYVFEQTKAETEELSFDQLMKGYSM